MAPRTTTGTHPQRIRRSSRASRLVLATTALLVFGSVIAVPTTAWAVPVPWRNCGSPTDAISIQRLDASAWPPQGGKEITLRLSWNLAEPLTKGSFAQITAQWSSGQTFKRTFPFDESPVAALFSFAPFGPGISQQQMPLPIPAGPYTQTLTLYVSKYMSMHTIDVDMAGFDGTGRQVVCMQLILPVK